MTEYDIKIVCPECGTNSPQKDKEKAESQVESHNANIHNGKEIAYVEGAHNPLMNFTDYINDVHKKRHIYYAYKNKGMLRGICPDCEEVVVEQEIDVLREKLEKHNSLKHNSESVAGIVTEDLDGTTEERLSELPGNGPNAAEILAKCNHKDEITEIQGESLAL